MAYRTHPHAVRALLHIWMLLHTRICRTPMATQTHITTIKSLLAHKNAAKTLQS